VVWALLGSIQWRHDTNFPPHSALQTISGKKKREGLRKGVVDTQGGRESLHPHSTFSCFGFFVSEEEARASVEPEEVAGEAMGLAGEAAQSGVMMNVFVNLGAQFGHEQLFIDNAKTQLASLKAKFTGKGGFIFSRPPDRLLKHDTCFCVVEAKTNASDAFIRACIAQGETEAGGLHFAVSHHAKKHSLQEAWCVALIEVPSELAIRARTIWHTSTPQPQPVASDLDSSSCIEELRILKQTFAAYCLVQGKRVGDLEDRIDILESHAAAQEVVIGKLKSEIDVLNGKVDYQGEHLASDVCRALSKLGEQSESEHCSEIGGESKEASEEANESSENAGESEEASEEASNESCDDHQEGIPQAAPVVAADPKKTTDSTLSNSKTDASQAAASGAPGSSSTCNSSLSMSVNRSHLSNPRATAAETASTAPVVAADPKKTTDSTLSNSKTDASQAAAQACAIRLFPCRSIDRIYRIRAQRQPRPLQPLPLSRQIRHQGQIEQQGGQQPVLRRNEIGR
jgi:uncharacterized coiled-coil protein SlyX